MPKSYRTAILFRTVVLDGLAIVYKRDMQNQEAVNRCMLVFWEQGFFKTPIEELVKACGLKSIWQQGGFFKEMLERYGKEVTIQLTAPLGQNRME